MTWNSLFTERISLVYRSSFFYNKRSFHIAWLITQGCKVLINSYSFEIDIVCKYIWGKKWVNSPVVVGRWQQNLWLQKRNSQIIYVVDDDDDEDAIDYKESL